MITFRQTCEKPYDKHNYRISHDGGKSQIFDDYEVMHRYWYTNQHLWTNATVEILDKKRKGKGF